ncbi:hypothetical protein KXD93_05455 [Mucilaginibacter sp. BJC16-A38]|uniref:hypothetical protein n=1 Tax=Mucilaginibacter phenanthrenivorans TaxID=1234842 RepID=UPI0021582EC1|nr:hypothetical protein [Mucilaginibacter phenanthrenivorans]MCR8557075.1 hypothetical protein [Mucilaginibacter phenanthrenivorans]
MKKVKLFQLIDLMEEIKKTDDLISASKKEKTSLLLINQYQTKKNQLIGSIINELSTPPLQSTQSYLLVKMILEKYYPAKAGDVVITDGDLSKLVAAI